MDNIRKSFQIRRQRMGNSDWAFLNHPSPLQLHNPKCSECESHIIVLSAAVAALSLISPHNAHLETNGLSKRVLVLFTLTSSAQWCDDECVMNVGISFYQKFSTYKLKRFHFPHYFRFFFWELFFPFNNCQRIFHHSIWFWFLSGFNSYILFLSSSHISFILIYSIRLIHSFTMRLYTYYYLLHEIISQNEFKFSFIRSLINFHFASHSFISL